jgi:beta-glucosidase
MQLRFFVSVLLVCSATATGDEPKQPTIGYRSAPLLTVDGLTFKDLNRNGKLDPFEDWRLPAEVRTADLVQRMSLEERVMVLPETVPRLAAMERAPGRSPSRRTSVCRGEWNI